MDNALVADAWAALAMAQELAPNASAQDQAYIEALAARYVAEPVDDRAPLDLAFADAMREVVAEYPDDLDAAAIFAEALMDTIPWNYWTPEGEPREATVEILAALESVLERNPDHPAANHYYIHATEASNTPELALPSAERLETLVPGAGHLVHMPAHTYWRVGRYADAYRINVSAHDADKHTVGGTPDQGTFYSLAYYPHNLHFLFAAGQMMGASEKTIQAARELVGSLPADTYRAIPMLEDFNPMLYYALVRFGKWEEILAESAPAEDLQLSTGMWNFAQGMALLRTGDVEGAQQALAVVQEIAAKPEMASQGLLSFASAEQILRIASGILAGEIAASQGDIDSAIAELEAAVAIQDSLPYIEPPAWFYPVRQTLGAILLEAERAEEAEAVFRKDLEQYAANGWSLFGLMTALEAQGKLDEAAEVKAQFEEAWQQADVELTASRF
jgi:tetratricopeptide (TPR) repeat protein